MLKERELEITLKCRKYIPSYAVQGYYVTLSTDGVEGATQVIPDMQPGEVLTLSHKLPDAPVTELTLTVYRPNGFSVLELGLGQ